VEFGAPAGAGIGRDHGVGDIGKSAEIGPLDIVANVENYEIFGACIGREPVGTDQRGDLGLGEGRRGKGLGDGKGSKGQTHGRSPGKMGTSLSLMAKKAARIGRLKLPREAEKTPTDIMELSMAFPRRRN